MVLWSGEVIGKYFFENKVRLQVIAYREMIGNDD